MSLFKVLPLLISMMKNINESESVFTNTPLWGNIIALLALYLASQCGYTLTAEDQAIILGFLNVVFQFFTTGKFKFWKKNNNEHMPETVAAVA